MKQLTILTFLLSLILLGCNPYSQDDFSELVVIESYAVANRPLPDVHVSRTLPAFDEYSFEEAAISNAIVQITWFDENGVEQDIFELSEVSPGVYRHTNGDHQVNPKAGYRLDVRFNDRDDEITATTIIPDQFEVLNTVKESVVYQSEDQLEIIVSATESAARQNVYVFNTLSQEPTFENLTPFYLNAVVNGDADLAEFSSNSSGLINEGNFIINPDQSITIQVPWLGIAFFGRNFIALNSVDKNMNDLIRSQDVQLGGSTLPPGEIQNLIYNVEGGIGVFGSFSTDTVQTRILRP